MNLKFRLHTLRLLCGCVIAAACAGVFATGAWAFNTIVLKTPAETLELGVFSAQLTGEGLTSAESGVYTLEAGTHTLTLQALGNAHGVVMLQVESLPEEADTEAASAAENSEPVVLAEEAGSEAAVQSIEPAILALTSETAGQGEPPETPATSETPAPALLGEYWAMLDASAQETAEVHFTLNTSAPLRLRLTVPEELPDSEDSELTNDTALEIGAEPIAEAALTPTPEPTPDPMATAMPAPSATPVPSAEPTAEPTPSAAPAPSATPTPSAAPTAAPSAAPTPGSEPLPSAAPEPTAEPAANPTPVPEAAAAAQQTP